MIIAIVTFVIISYCCLLINTTFKELQHSLSTKEECSDNEQ